MAVIYYGSHISEHLVKTPEGYLICYAVPSTALGPRRMERENWDWAEIQIAPSRCTAWRRMSSHPPPGQL